MEVTMKARWLSALACAMLLGSATVGLAATEGEFDNLCTMGLALGQEIPTDCSVNAEIDGKTYCFGNEQAKILFLKKPEELSATRARPHASPSHP
jgi:YHS domain-containing protein